MTWSIVFACVWAILASLVGLIPMRSHWPAAWVLIATGIPILGYVTYQNGPFWGLLVLAAGASILRWPLFFAYRRLRGWLSS
jgi:hypothetical protein